MIRPSSHRPSKSPAHDDRTSRADLRVVKLEAPKARRVCIELKVMAMPTLLLFKDGAEVSRVGGQTLTGAGVREWLDSAVS